MRFLYVNFKNFSNISNLNWFFTQKRKDLPVGFLIRFRIIKDFQNFIKIALIFIKNSFFKSKFAKNSWKFTKCCRFPLIFRLIFLIFSLVSGYSAPEPPTNQYFQNFLNFSLNFRENFDKILKFFQKSQNFLKIFHKIINFSLIF